MKNRESCRLILDLKKHGIDVFDEFGRYNYVNTQDTLPTHTHPDMIEICFLAKGNQEYFVGDCVFKLYGGDVFVTFPNEIHGTGEIPEKKGCLYWMVLKKPQEGKDYIGLNYLDACELFSRLLQLPERVFNGGDECARLFRKIISVYFQDKNLLTRIELNNSLVSLLLYIIHVGEKKTSGRISERITKIIGYIDENLFEEFDLEQLADKCNLSVSRFKHLFKEEIGIPPSEYIIRRKMEKAQKMIEEQRFSIKDIAYDLGFSSPAYFSTVFRQYNGYSPISYKKRSKPK